MNYISSALRIGPMKSRRPGVIRLVGIINSRIRFCG
jgi:hypothetical protein